MVKTGIKGKKVSEKERQSNDGDLHATNNRRRKTARQ
jgi:hypothetical protein